MSEKTPYEKLGVSETAPFEEIQKAKDHLSHKHSDNFETIESIESAYDAIVMERLKLRQEGKVNVPDNIRFAEHEKKLALIFQPLISIVYLIGFNNFLIFRLLMISY